MFSDYLASLATLKKPKLVRGDVGFGSESWISDCERVGVPYLFKVRRSAGVKAEFADLLCKPDAWRVARDGWQCAERTVRLQSWSRERRLVFARRPVETMPKRRKAPPKRVFTQLGIPGMELVETSDSQYADGYEWHALVTDLDLPGMDILPLYRERGDCENIFDEMKNQWGWRGFTAHSLKQTALFAGLAVIAANLWNIFARLGEDGSHREATTSRPLLQSCIARVSCHARLGIVTIYTSSCAKAASIYREITSVLSRIASASQLTSEQRRQLIIAWAFRQYGLVKRLFPPLLGAQQTLPLT